MKKAVKGKDSAPSDLGPSRVSKDYVSVTYVCSPAHEKMGHRPRSQVFRASRTSGRRKWG